MDRALFFDQPGVGLSADYLWGGDQEEVDFVHVPLLLIAARLRLFVLLGCGLLLQTSHFASMKSLLLVSGCRRTQDLLI